MKILVITDSNVLTDFVKGAASHINIKCEILSTKPENGRKSLIAFQPELVILNADADVSIDMADYIVKLAPKYAVPIIVVTEQLNLRYAMISAGAVDVIRFHRNTDENGGKFMSRLAGSIQSAASAVKENKIHVLAGSSGIIAIGGSTGSTNALPEILKRLKPDCPPVVCVLHMPEGYTGIYAKQLDSFLDLNVCEAKSGMYVSQGQVIIAAGAKHLRVFRDKKGYFITSESGVRVGGHCPSVNVLFDSVAYAAKSNAVGVILTGMGRDGADGMLNMKKMGAYNIAQDESSSVVYGMPKAAYELGAVNIRCPLEEIGDKINVYLKIKEKRL